MSVPPCSTRTISRDHNQTLKTEDELFDTLNMCAKTISIHQSISIAGYLCMYLVSTF